MAQDNAWDDVHSDIVGFNRDISSLALQAVSGMHPVVKNMNESGAVGQGVYNAKTLFGDLDFWQALKMDYPDVFQKLVAFYQTLRPVNQGAWYGFTTAYPLQALREYFPDVYQYIQENYEGEFVAPDGPGIDFTRRVLPKEAK